MTALLYETEKLLNSDRCFTDSWLRKWIIIKSFSDTIIEQNDSSFFSYFSVISDPSEVRAGRARQHVTLTDAKSPKND